MAEFADFAPLTPGPDPVRMGMEGEVHGTEGALNTSLGHSGTLAGTPLGMIAHPVSRQGTDGYSEPGGQTLSRVLTDAPVVNFSSMAHLPSNSDAIYAAERFTAGLYTLVAIVGPSGWGKSHLLHSVSVGLVGFEAPPVQVYSATEWALGMARTESSGPLLLDNVQDALEKARVRQALRMALERRVRSARPTMLSFTAAKPLRTIRGFLPCSREWVWAEIEAPEAVERMLVIQQMAAAEHLDLGPAITKLIGARMRGNGRTISGALKRLKLYETQWNGPRATLRACGILDPFFADNSGWDLRETIARAVEREGGDRSLAVFVMLREASLSEAHVSRYFGIEPSDAYQRALQFEREAAENLELSSIIERVIDRVIRTLLQD